MKVLITGANGFLGRNLVSTLLGTTDFYLVGAVRGEGAVISSRESYISVGDISFDTDWHAALSGVDVVIHLAARAHVLSESFRNPLYEFRRVNVGGAVSLAKQALEHRVKRFIFISSIGVNGGVTTNVSINEKTPCLPHADYAVSKMEAEEELRTITRNSSMELVIIRPPLVYSSDAPGNFSRLLKAVDMGLPLPLGSVRNARSIIALENLTDFIRVCVDNRAAGNELFLVSDGKSFSTPDIIRMIGRGMGKRSILLPVPDVFLRSMAAIFCRTPVYTQLCKSLVIDSSKARSLLGWTPPIDPVDALVQAGTAYKFRKNSL
ncbi:MULTISPECIES: NAD-dependent epimerase/dehydratase family protein [unclassified Pseudomonas]|uniref:NAD-dependent epimerase/dehydratase family protein n=1 Tax=unclassified Pseudomonas TaxID=196821 RepID=UPI00087146BA|nr:MULTISPECIES: NAD-dependent epimerase/dehydratase family protein [unclassified Pseudomonas]SCW62891.1 Nucleoside-diphosphate-sugar epimerase [Pseudomonas sp. NFACC05-1]SFL61030.1 Nucleoside-diphosphate-sugar epimerase [Pseudomonas sp. NFACC46-3]